MKEGMLLKSSICLRLNIIVSTSIIESLAAVGHGDSSDQSQLQPAPTKNFNHAGIGPQAAIHQKPPVVQDKSLPMIFADDSREWDWSKGDQSVSVARLEASILGSQIQSDDPDDFQTVVTINKTTTTSNRAGNREFY